MDDHTRETCRDRTPPAAVPPPEPVRTRWTPKPEQILILESIFNSGMVNPPKDETVRIRRLLEKFGSVGDANVFYWFQNRRSRSRRRQRQLQASLHLAAAPAPLPPQQASCPSPPPPPALSPSSSSSSGFLIDEGGGGGGGGGADDLFSISRQMAAAGGFIMQSAAAEAPPPPPYFMCSSDDAEQLQYQQPGSSIIVFIDGVASEVPRGPIDLGAIFGQNVMLVHSSGEILPVNEHGILMQSLQMGESYFLVTEPT